MKICIVDDEREVREGIIRKCRAIGRNLEVLDAGFGRQALEFVLRHRPDLVLMDILMPGMNGLQLLQHIKPILPRVQVVFVSGYSDFEYARQAIRLEISDYLLKPVDEDDLLKVIRKAEQKLFEDMSTDWNNIISELNRSYVDIGNVRHHSPTLWFNSSVPKAIVLRNSDDHADMAGKEVVSFDDRVVGCVSVVTCTEEGPNIFVSSSEFCEVYLWMRNKWFEDGTYDPSAKDASSSIAAAHRLMEAASLAHLSLGWVAEQLKIHPITLSKQYKLQTGTSFVDAVIARKLKTACQLLMETDMKIQDICREAGYGDDQFFARQFKKKYGVTPYEFRKRHRHKPEGS